MTTLDPLDELLLSVLAQQRAPLCAWQITPRLSVVIGLRAVQKRLRRLEEQQLVQRPNGERKGYRLAA